MFRNKLLLFGFGFFIFMLYMQYSSKINEIAKSAYEKLPKSNVPVSAPANFINQSSNIPPAAAVTPGLKLFDEKDYQEIIGRIGAIDMTALKQQKTINDYKNHTINIFVPKITSSHEEDMKSAPEKPQTMFNVMINLADISYVGYYDTPAGMAAILKSKASSDINVLKTGDTLPNSNLKLKFANERFVILQNLSDQTDVRVYLTSR